MQLKTDEDYLLECAWVALEEGNINEILPHSFYLSTLKTYKYDMPAPEGFKSRNYGADFFFYVRSKAPEGECESCGERTDAALERLLPTYGGSFQNGFAHLFLCDDCYTQKFLPPEINKIPLELGITPENYQKRVLSTANSNIPEKLTDEQAYALYIVYNLLLKAGQLSEKVKKSIGQGDNTSLWPRTVTNQELYSAELEALLDWREAPADYFHAFVEKALVNEISNDSPVTMARVVAALGLCGEAIEYMNEIVGPALYPINYEFEEKRAEKELGDVSYYWFWSAFFTKVRPQLLWWRNRWKLWKRFKGKFSAEASKKRVDVKPSNDDKAA